MIIVQTKVDLIDQAEMTEEEVNEMAESLGLEVFQVCAKENQNV